jgi:hypothetical protein
MNILMLLGFAAVFALGTACFTPSSQPDQSALAAAWARRPEAQRTSTQYLGPHYAGGAAITARWGSPKTNSGPRFG